MRNVMRGSVMRGGVMLGGVMRSQRGEIYLLKDGVPQPPTTFSRASTGTYWDANGVLQTAAVDELRLTHNPATGEFQGLLIEGQRANSLLHNRNVTLSPWVDQFGASATQDQVGIDGVANTAWTIADNSGANLSRRIQAIVVANDSATHSAFAFIKKDADQTRFPKLMLDLNGGTSVRTKAHLNTATGAVATIAGPTPKVIDAGDWWQVVLKITNNSTGNTSLEFRVFPADSSNFGVESDVTTTGSIIYDYGKVELNSAYETYPTLTGASASTRGRDIVTVENLDFVNLNEGTFVVEMYPRPYSESGLARILAGQGTNNMLQLDGSDSIGAYNGVVLKTTNSYTPGARTKAAFRYSGTQRSLVLNGGPIATDSNFSSGEFDVGKLYIGAISNGDAPANCPIKNVRYIPRALSDGELQAVTAL